MKSLELDDISQKLLLRFDVTPATKISEDSTKESPIGNLVQLPKKNMLAIVPLDSSSLHLDVFQELLLKNNTFIKDWTTMQCDWHQFLQKIYEVRERIAPRKKVEIVSKKKGETEKIIKKKSIDKTMKDSSLIKSTVELIDNAASDSIFLTTLESDTIVISDEEQQSKRRRADYIHPERRHRVSNPNQISDRERRNGNTRGMRGISIRGSFRGRTNSHYSRKATSHSSREAISRDKSRELSNGKLQLPSITESRRSAVPFDSTAKLHPSWQARIAQNSKERQLPVFQGTKIRFTDD